MFKLLFNAIKVLLGARGERVVNHFSVFIYSTNLLLTVTITQPWMVQWYDSPNNGSGGGTCNQHTAMYSRKLSAKLTQVAKS